MSRALADSSVIIDLLRRRSGAIQLLDRLAGDGTELWSTTVVRVEIRAGMRPGEEAATEAALDLFAWQDVTTDIADRAGMTAARYLRSHPGIDTIDHIIAAAAEALGARLLTLNVRHFPMIPGLEPAYVSGS